MSSAVGSAGRARYKGRGGRAKLTASVKGARSHV
jgi:hypothetical protein